MSDSTHPLCQRGGTYVPCPTTNLSAPSPSHRDWGMDRYMARQGQSKPPRNLMELNPQTSYSTSPTSPRRGTCMIPWKRIHGICETGHRYTCSQMLGCLLQPPLRCFKSTALPLPAVIWDECLSHSVHPLPLCRVRLALVPSRRLLRGFNETMPAEGSAQSRARRKHQ